MRATRASSAMATTGRARDGRRWLRARCPLTGADSIEVRFGVPREEPAGGVLGAVRRSRSRGEGRPRRGSRAPRLAPDAARAAPTAHPIRGRPGCRSPLEAPGLVPEPAVEPLPRPVPARARGVTALESPPTPRRPADRSTGRPPPRAAGSRHETSSARGRFTCRERLDHGWLMALGRREAAVDRGWRRGVWTSARRGGGRVPAARSRAHDRLVRRRARARSSPALAASGQDWTPGLGPRDGNTVQGALPAIPASRRSAACRGLFVWTSPRFPLWGRPQVFPVEERVSRLVGARFSSASSWRASTPACCSGEAGSTSVNVELVPRSTTGWPGPSRRRASTVRRAIFGLPLDEVVIEDVMKPLLPWVEIRPAGRSRRRRPDRRVDLALELRLPLRARKEAGMEAGARTSCRRSRSVCPRPCSATCASSTISAGCLGADGHRCRRSIAGTGRIVRGAGAGGPDRWR